MPLSLSLLGHYLGSSVFSERAGIRDSVYADVGQMWLFILRDIWEAD